MALADLTDTGLPGDMVRVQPPVQEQPRPTSSRATILRVTSIISLAICLVGLSTLVASSSAAVNGTLVHYVVGLALPVSLVLASGTLIAGRLWQSPTPRLIAAKVALGLDLAVCFLALLFILMLVTMDWG